MNFKLLLVFFQLTVASNTYSQNYDTIRTKLELQYWQSLKNRRAMSQLISENKQASMSMDSLVTIMQKNDGNSLLYVRDILDSYGWLGKNDIGSLANNSIFFTVQHSDLSTMKKYYPLFAKSVEVGESNRINLATMEDRILVYENLPQKYGTQSYFDKKGNQYLEKIEDLKMVNKRRKEIGLKSLNKKIKKGELNID